MRVPRVFNPQSRAPDMARGYQRASTPDLNPLFDGIRRFADKLGNELEARQKSRERMDVNNIFMEETNALQLDYDEREQAAPLGAKNFALDINGDYAMRSEGVLQGLRDKGYDEELIGELGHKFASNRQHYVGKALQFEQSSYDKKVTLEVDRHRANTSRFVASNPEAFASAVAESDAFVDNIPDWSEDRKAVAKAKARHEFAVTGAESLLQKAPQQIIGALDPQGLYAKQLNSAPISGGAAEQTGPFDLNSYAQKVAPVEGTGKNPKSSASGHFQFIDSTWKAYHAKVFGDQGLTEAQILAKRNDPVVANTLMQAFTNDNIKILTNADVPVNDTSVYLAHFLGPETAVKVAQANLDAPISQVVGKASIAANPGVFNKVHTVRDMLIWSADKMDAPHTNEALVVAEPDLPAGSRTLVQGETLSPSAQFELETGVRVPEPGMSGERQGTGIAALDELDGIEQLGVLKKAYSILRENNTEAKAAIRVEHENRVAALSQGKDPGPSTVTDEVGVNFFGETAWGQVKGEEQAARAGGLFMTGMGTASQGEMEGKLAGLKPTDPASPTYKIELKNWDESRRAAQANLAERESDPVGYVYKNFPRVRQAFENAQDGAGRKVAYNQLLSAYERLGIPQNKWLPVPEEQVALMAQKYDQLNPAQKLGQLEAWVAEMPSKLWVPFLRQMNGNDGNGPGYDIFMRHQLQKHPEYRAIMRDVFAGQNLLRDDPAQKPSDVVVDQAFNKTLSLQGLNGTAARIWRDAAAAIYIARGGKTTGNPARLENPDLYKDSLRRAVGGLKDNQDTGFASFHGKYEPVTILPPNMTKQVWEQRLSRQTLQTLTNNSLGKKPPVTKFGNQPRMQDIVDDGVFVLRAPGQYAIKFVGQDGVLLDRTGEEFIVKVLP